MGHRSPSHFRCQGRRAYRDYGTPDTDPMTVCPYQFEKYEAQPGVFKDRPNLVIEHRRQHWLEGWGEAREEAISLAIAKADLDEYEQHEWSQLAEECPWRGGTDGATCAAWGFPCERENCAPWHFRRNT